MLSQLNFKMLTVIKSPQTDDGTDVDGVTVVPIVRLGVE